MMNLRKRVLVQSLELIWEQLIRGMLSIVLLVIKFNISYMIITNITALKNGSASDYSSSYFDF
jgi:uncharacterized protein YaiL (DUF2058 family)